MKMNRKLLLLLSLVLGAFCCSGWAQLTPERVAELHAELDEEAGEDVPVAKVEDEKKVAGGVSLDPEAFGDSIFVMDGWELTSDLNLKKPFDAAELSLGLYSGAIGD